MMVGGARCVTDAWAMQFFETLTNGTAEQGKKPGPRDHEAALKELEVAGIS